MSDEDVVKRVCYILGASKVRRYMPSNPRDKRDRSAMYECCISGHEAAEWMLEVLPHMGERRSKKIRSILNEWDPHRSGKGHCKSCAAFVIERDSAKAS